MLPVEPGALIAQNPFYVLELPTAATRAEVEREGLRLIGMLEAGLAGASRYRSPLGSHERSPDGIRQAMGALRDPGRRLLDELWARPPAIHAPGDAREADPVAGALGLHVECLDKKQGSLAGADVTRLLVAWESALANRDLHRAMAERALQIGLPSSAPSTDALLSQARDQVADDVAALVIRARVTLAEVEAVGEIGLRACRLVRDELLNRIQVASRALKQRVRDGREIPPDGERWEWVTLRHLYQETVQQGGTELRHLAWDEFHSSLMDLVVWLWNTRKLLDLSDEIEHWLLEEARTLQDGRSVDQHQRNLKESRPRGRVAPAMAPPSESGPRLAPLATQVRHASSNDPSATALIIALLMLLFFVVLLTILVRLGSSAGSDAFPWMENAPRWLGLVGLCWWLRCHRSRP